MLLRFFLYGLIGWCGEVIWTALYDGISGTARPAGDAVARRTLTTSERWRLEGRTYLWMLPIYGSSAFLFEPAHEALHGLPWLARGAIYMLGIFAVEYVAGWILKRATGRCPWAARR